MEKLTIAELAEQIWDNNVNIDVVDSEIDMIICLCHTIGDCNNSYEKFLEALCRNVKVVKLNDNNSILVADFSNYFKPFNDKFIEASNEMGWVPISFDGDETYYDFVLWLEELIPGNETDKTYSKLISILN